MGAVGPNHAVPVSKAGKAIVRAIEKRARFAYAPRWVIGMLLARTLVQPLQEKATLRQGVDDMLAEARQEPAKLTTEQPSEQREPVA
jgi:hypothetical protein